MECRKGVGGMNPMLRHLLSKAWLVCRVRVGIKEFFMAMTYILLIHMYSAPFCAHLFHKEQFSPALWLNLRFWRCCKMRDVL